MQSLSFFLLFCLISSLALANPAKEVEPKRVLILGDSITAGYGVEQDQAYPKLIENELNKKGHKVKVIGAGISGSTSASALGRLKWQLKKKPDYLVLALGANDGLRGVPVETTRKNLTKTIELAQKEKIKVVLAGMLVPPNYGKKYYLDFQKMFKKLAKDKKLTFIPFLLDNVAGKKKLNISDGIHPNPEGHKVIAKTVLQKLEPLL